MKIARSKKSLMAVSIALACVVVLSGTFAWFTAADSVTNHLETGLLGDGSVELVEVFTPPTEWVPGQEVTKQVSVANTGNTDALVRVSFEEMLKKLNGVATPQDARLTASSGYIPQTFNPENFMKAPWVKASTVFTTVNAPADVEIWVQSDGKGAYSFVSICSIDDITGYAGQYQRTTAEYKVSDDQKTLTVSNVKYYAYEGTISTQAAWGLQNVTTAPLTPPLKANIGHAVLDEKILLNYSSFITTDLAGSANKWYYNEADGFFYYMGVLESGQFTNRLLESIKLDETAGNEYGGMEFDLVVNMQAIQNTEAAIKDAAGWNLSNAALISALAAYCV